MSFMRCQANAEVRGTLRIPLEVSSGGWTGHRGTGRQQAASASHSTFPAVSTSCQHIFGYSDPKYSVEMLNAKAKAFQLH